MEEVGQRPPRPVRVPVPRPPPPPESWISTLQSVAYSLGLSLRAFMMLLWRACRLPAGQDDDDGEPKNQKNKKQATADGQGDEARQRKSEENAKKRSKKKAKTAADKEAKAEAAAEAKKKRRQAEAEAARQAEAKKARQEEEAARQEEEEARRKKAESDMKKTEKLVAERKKAEQEEMKRRQREAAMIIAKETRIKEEEAERKREDNRRRRAEADNKNEYEDEEDVHTSYWSKNHDKRKKQCLGCYLDDERKISARDAPVIGNIPEEVDRHNSRSHKGVDMGSCKKKGCFVNAKKRDIQLHGYYCHGLPLSK